MTAARGEGDIGSAAAHDIHQPRSGGGHGNIGGDSRARGDVVGGDNIRRALSHAAKGDGSSGYAVDRSCKRYLNVIGTGCGQLRIEQVKELSAIDGRGTVAAQRAVHCCQVHAVEAHRGHGQGRGAGVLQGYPYNQSAIRASSDRMRPGEGSESRAGGRAGLVKSNGRSRYGAAKGKNPSESEEGILRPAEKGSNRGVHGGNRLWCDRATAKRGRDSKREILPKVRKKRGVRGGNVVATNKGCGQTERSPQRLGSRGADDPRRKIIHLSAT